MGLRASVPVAGTLLTVCIATTVQHAPQPLAFRAAGSNGLDAVVSTRCLQALDATELTVVATAATLAEMCTHLEACPEVAVDLEHHSYRSFLGITCLMQVQTLHAPVLP